MNRNRVFSLIGLAIIILAIFAYSNGLFSRQETIVDSGTGEERYNMVTLLPKDAIPSIDNPKFVSGAEADAQYLADELVLGVEIEGETRAYSVPFLSGHEIVNDEIGGVPIAVTW